MAKIQLVIEIEEGIIKSFNRENEWTALLCADMRDALNNGTPLPKGHGRLIDADKIIHTEVYDDEYEEFIEKTMTVNEFIEAYTDEGLAPTIIEADKED